MFFGSIVALATPMQADGSIDFIVLRQLIEWHIAAKTSAIVVAGTTGESPTLDENEQKALIIKALEFADGKISIIAGTGSCCTKKSLAATKFAASAGVAACLLVTPYYNKPTQEGLYQHYAFIAEVDVPQILYNVPGRTAVDLKPDTVARLSTLGNIIGIKDATGDLSRLSAMKQIIHNDKFMFYSGDDLTSLDFIQQGGHGAISVTANVAPLLMAKMCTLALTGDFAAARAIDVTLEKLHKNLFVEANPIPVKWALAQMNKISPYIRLPLTPLTSGYHAILADALKTAGAL